MRKTKAEHSSENDVVRVSDSTLRGFIGYDLKRAMNAVRADLRRALEPFELRMLTLTALVLIVDNPGMRQSQLADAMDVERPNLVVLLDELERRELIVRDRVPTDRRAYSLKATLAGRRLYEQAIEAVKAHEARLFRGLDDDSRALLSEALRNIQTHTAED